MTAAAADNASSEEADAAAGGGKSGQQQQRQKNNNNNKSGGENKSLLMTKRQQRLKGPNPANTWPQQPKIQSPAARAKAYLRVAGLLGGDSSSKRSVQLLLDPSIDLHSPEIKFGRKLGGTDQRKRHLAVTKLQHYLKARCHISNENGGLCELDLLKLWKGLWYTLYMADKVPVQDELSKRLAELIWCVAGTEEEDEYAGQAYLIIYGGEQQGSIIAQEEEEQGSSSEDEKDAAMEEIEEELLVQQREDDSSSSEEGEDNNDDDESNDENETMVDTPSSQENTEVDDLLVRHCRGAHLAALFVKTFFQTIRREWGNIDKHRVDKFYTLIRLMIHQVFRYMAIRHWNIGIIRLFNDTLFEEVLSQTPNGVRYHLIDISLEELARVNAEIAPMPLTEATFLDCLEPYFALAQMVDDKLVQARVLEKMLKNFLDNFSVLSNAALMEQSEDNNAADEAAALVLDQVHVGSVAQFIFELASDTSTQNKYRKSLYDMHKAYMKRLNKVGKDVVLDMEEETSDIAETMYDADMDTEEEHVEDEVFTATDSNESRKRKKRKLSAEKMDEEAAPKPLQPSETPKKGKKKKKGGKTNSPTHMENVGGGNLLDSEKIVSDKTADEEGQGSSAKKQKKNKKKRKKKEKERSPSANEHLAGEEAEDEMIMISNADQKKAAKAAAAAAKDEDAATPSKGSTKKCRKSRKRKSAVDERISADEAEDSATKAKRVSFGRVNHSKSYKASMKSLKTMDHPSTAEKTPDRSILLKKLEARTPPYGIGSVKKKKSRKKATDYF